MKLIVGLGNPGNEYKLTRHNVGFMCIDNFASENGIEINRSGFDGLYGELMINGEKVILLKPQTYMNLSGRSVRKCIDFFKIKIEDVLVISDDLDLDVGRYKLKMKGGSGGHNGLKNIESELKTSNYKRLKIGISNNKQIATSDYVLGKFDAETIKIFDKLFCVTDVILKDFIVIDFDKLMTRYNKK